MNLTGSLQLATSPRYVRHNELVLYFDLTLYVIFERVCSHRRVELNIEIVSRARFVEICKTGLLRRNVESYATDGFSDNSNARENGLR